MVPSRGHVPSQLACPNGHVGWYGSRPLDLLVTTPALRDVHVHHHAALLFVARPVLVYVPIITSVYVQVPTDTVFCDYLVYMGAPRT